MGSVTKVKKIFHAVAFDQVKILQALTRVTWYELLQRSMESIAFL